MHVEAEQVAGTPTNLTINEINQSGIGSSDDSMTILSNNIVDSNQDHDKRILKTNFCDFPKPNGLINRLSFVFLKN